jgi:hypothetical protein
MSEATAGTLVGYLRLDSSQWHEELRRAGIAAEALGASSPDIDIDVNAEEAVARLRTVGEEAERTGKRIEKAGIDGKNGLNPLAAAIGILGPTIAPLGGAVAGLAAGLGVMGAAGVLAILGIKREMEEGTTLGEQYTEVIGDAKGVLDGITHSGAEAFFGSVTQIVATLKDHTGELTPLLAETATYLGQTANNLLDGALSGIEALRPVIREVSAYVRDLSERFANGMDGEGFRGFVDYISGVLPQVIDTLSSLATAVVHIVTAASPLGGVVLQALELVATAISAIDPTVLSVLATVAGSAFLALNAYKALSSLPTIFANIATGASNMGAGFGAAATGAQRFQAAMGLVGLAVGAATIIYQAFAERSQSVATATANYTDALIESNGAITDNVRLAALKHAQDEGMVDDARLLGISTTDLVGAMLGEKGAIENVNAAYAAKMANLRATNDGLVDGNRRIDAAKTRWDSLQSGISGSNEALADAKVKQQDHNAVLAAGSQAQGDYARNVYTATDYVNEQKAAIDAWKASVDSAITNTLSLEAAHDAATTRLKGLTKSIKDNGEKFSGNTKEALANREAIRSYAEAKVREASEVQRTTGSNVKANAVIRDGRKALYETLLQMTGNKAEAQRLTDKYLAIPKNIKTNVDLASEAAQRRASALKAIIAEIRSKTITITVKQRLQNEAKLIQNGVNDYANGGITAYANGGVTAFANGAENHVAQIAPAGAMRLWAEPETGGEAYIPLHPGKRDRSLAIWEETGKRLGALGQGSGDGGEKVAAALALLATELRSLHSIPAAIERGAAQRARLDRLDARARYSA